MSSAGPAADKVLTKRVGAVAEIILNNPARHNAISLDMWQRMAELLAEAAADTGVRVLIVAGAGGKPVVVSTPTAAAPAGSAPAAAPTASAPAGSCPPCRR